MNNKKFLISLYQNTRTGIQSIKDMYPKFRSSKLKQLMKDQEEKYNSFCNETRRLANLKNISLKENSFFQKAMLWTSINFSTITNKSSSHIAELFLLGTVRGTLDIYKALKTYKDASDDIVDLAKRLLEFEEQSFEQIKKYLRD